MGFKVQNPSGSQPFYANVYGTWYSIDADSSITVDDAEVASGLGAQGAIVSDTLTTANVGPALAAASAGLAVESDADAEARARAQAANAKTASVPASVADEQAKRQITTGPEVTAEQAQATASELKGASLDDALDGAGLSKAGTADEKRARYAQWLAEQSAGVPSAELEQQGDADTSGDSSSS